MATSSTTEPAVVLSALDVSAGSIAPGCLLPGTRPRPVGFLRYAVVCSAAIIIGFGVPLLLVLGSGQSLLRSTDHLDLPYLLDFNVVCLSLFTLPFLLFLALREQRLVPDCLRTVLLEHVVVFELDRPELFRDRWQRRLRVANTLANAAGVVLGLFIAVLAATQTVGGVHGDVPGHPIVQWQTVGAPANSLNAAGWMFLGLQVFPFVFLLTAHIVRQSCVYLLLRDLVRTTSINVGLLHSDGLGGLRPIAALALHYHYAIAAMGLNLGVMLITTHRLERATGPESITAMVVYVLFAPILFLTPLWPFRAAMRTAKRSALSSIGEGFSHHLRHALSSTTADDGHLASAERFTGLHKTIAAFPEWPFDWATLRKFWVTFLVPGYTIAIDMVWKALLTRGGH
jgi:hypothetical protein